MKNYVKNLLRGGVMMLAVVFAFAFTQPMVSQDIFGSPDGGQTWENATNLQVGVAYECNIGIVDEHCLYYQPIYDPAFGVGMDEERFVMLP
ncbi:hypothetical protein [Belliella pelovolcani]|uniref:hypothetical protein n=1 Tax=Belliella pelovolcani TaxID=529505 RepID=UPI00391CD4C0